MKKIEISKNLIKPNGFLMVFDFTKQTSLKSICFYRLFENREISNVKKNVIKPDDLSTFRF